MEESLKQLIRCTRDVVCEQGNKFADEVKTSLRQTGEKVITLVGYVGIDQGKINRMAATAVFYKDIIERDCGRCLNHIDVGVANDLINSLSQQMFHEHSIKSNTHFTTKLYWNVSLENHNFRNRYMSLDTGGDEEYRRQGLLSDIIWHALRRDPVSDSMKMSGRDKKKSAVDEKIRSWNRRIDEVDIVRKCGTPCHLISKTENKNANMKSRGLNEAEEIQKESYVIEKLKRKCEELKRILHSKKTSEANSRESIPADDMKKNPKGDCLASETARKSVRELSHDNPEGTKSAKERSNQSQAMSEKFHADHGDVDVASGGDAAEALTIQIPANVHRIILMKNGCRIAVEV